MQKMAASLVSLPKLSPRPSNVAGEPLSEWQLAVNEEAAMRKRIAKLKNELHRKRQLVSISEAQRTRDHRASALREHLDEIRGNHTNYLVADVMPLSEDEVTKLSELFNAKCLPATPTTPRISWYTCFKNVDVDSSGRITFKEFASLVRMREGGLNMSAEALSDAQLRALWRALDDDGNGSISTGEFGHFMRKGEEKAAESARARLLAARQAAQRRQRAEGREADGSALTAQLASEEAASEEELREHSALFNQCLYKAVGETDGGAWYRLFRSVDHNRSGRISYDEYEVAVREILALKKSDLADGKLRRLWKALDVDNSGSLSHGEWGRFMKIGQPQGGASPRAQMLAKRFAKAEAAQAEKQRQAEKEKQQFAALASPRFDSIEPSSAEELVALSQTFAEALALLYPHSSPASQWYAVLKEYHHGTTSRSAAVVSTAVPGAAASGVSPACAKGNSAGLRFGFDELRNLVRHGMQLSHSQVGCRRRLDARPPRTLIPLMPSPSCPRPPRPLITSRSSFSRHLCPSFSPSGEPSQAQGAVASARGARAGLHRGRRLRPLHPLRRGPRHDGASRRPRVRPCGRGYARRGGHVDSSAPRLPHAPAAARRGARGQADLP